MVSVPASTGSAIPQLAGGTTGPVQEQVVGRAAGLAAR